MKEEQTSILNVLMYLFHHHMGSAGTELGETDEQKANLSSKLKDIGFSEQSIKEALNWLLLLKNTQTQLADMPDAGTQSTRVFSPYECSILSTECRDYLLGLKRISILTSSQLELVIDLAIQLKIEGVDLSLIQWVTLMVLYHATDSEAALANMELLVLNEAVGEVH